MSDKESRLGLSAFVTVTAIDRRIQVNVDSDYMAQISELDGCYALKSNVPAVVADSRAIHDRYKDLAMVESAFRTCKTSHLEVRPVFVRTEANTRGHVLVVMLAYILVRQLKQAWREIDLTVEEGLAELDRISAMELSLSGTETLLRIPEPSPLARELLGAVKVNLPAALPKSKVVVDTKKKLVSERKRI